MISDTTSKLLTNKQFVETKAIDTFAQLIEGDFLLRNTATLYTHTHPPPDAPTRLSLHFICRSYLKTTF
jgi:hypothetical protein